MENDNKTEPVAKNSVDERSLTEIVESIKECADGDKAMAIEELEVLIKKARSIKNAFAKILSTENGLDHLI